MVYKRVRGWTSGQSLPAKTFVEYPPPPGMRNNFKTITNIIFKKLV